MSTEIQLSPSQLKEVISILESIVPEAKAWVYGSRAKGTAYNGGDLNLILSAESAIEWHRMQKLKRAFTESELPFFVDVFDQSTMDPKSFALIRGERVLLKQSGS